MVRPPVQSIIPLAKALVLCLRTDEQNMLCLIHVIDALCTCLLFWRSGVVGVKGVGGGKGGNFSNCLFVSWPTKPLNNGVNPFRKELATIKSKVIASRDRREEQSLF